MYNCPEVQMSLGTKTNFESVCMRFMYNKTEANISSFALRSQRNLYQCHFSTPWNNLRLK